MGGDLSGTLPSVFFVAMGPMIRTLSADMSFSGFHRSCTEAVVRKIVGSQLRRLFRMRPAWSCSIPEEPYAAPSHIEEQGTWCLVLMVKARGCG